MAITRADVLTAVQNDSRFGSQTVKTSLAYEWFNDFEQMAWDIMTGTNPKAYASTQNYTITSNPQSITLPDGFADIKKNGLGFYVINSSTNLPDTDRGFIQSEPGASYQGWYQDSETTAVLTGVVVGQTVRLYYIAAPTRATSYDGTDTLLIPDRYKEFAVSYIRYRHFIDKNLQDFLALEQAYLADREAEFRKGIINKPTVIRIPYIIRPGTY